MLIFLRLAGIKKIVLFYRCVRPILVINKPPFNWVFRAQSSIFTHIKLHIAEIEKTLSLCISTRLFTVCFKQHQICEHEILYANSWSESYQKLPGHILSCRFAFEESHIDGYIMSLFKGRIIHINVHWFNVCVLILWLRLEIFPYIRE
jgi:hypothetical protein